MESALRPRDIQARIRAGESVEAVAEAAGVTPEKIDAFAAPVIAEREHVAGLAQTHPVRRRGETTSNRTLRSAVNEHVASTDMADEPSWDAWKLEDRRWQVELTYGPEDARLHALFVYDQTGRFSTASNYQARLLVGDEAPESPVHPAEGSSADDELALVRAIQTPQSALDLDDGDADETGLDLDHDDEDEGEPTVALDEANDIDDAFEEGELAEVDGVYDIIPPTSNMDVLYDMLSSFDEDSVKIYAGLITPKDSSTTEDALSAASVEPDTDEPEEPVAEEPAAEEPAVAEQSEPEEEVEADDVVPAAEPKPAATIEAESEAKVIVVEPEQPSLVDDEETGNEPTRPLRRPSRKKRASVPSWDEIMFGGPPPKPGR